jgi:hypothetical protein
MTLDEFFGGWEQSRPIFETLRAAIDALGPVEMQITTSQIAFRRRRAFAWAWIPGRYLHGRGAPLVVSIALDKRDSSPRWKEIVQPNASRYMHHLELFSAEAIDHQVREWLRQAWLEAG